MSVIRTIHNKENPYVQLNKKALWDPNLSIATVGLWARCMSRPDDWIFSIKEMVSKFKEGKTAIYRCINELIENGYAIKGQRVKQNDGSKKGGKRFLFDTVEYIFFEFKITLEEKKEYEKNFQKIFTLSGFLPPQSLLPQNAPLLNIEEELKTDKNNIIAPPIPKKKPKPLKPMPAGGNNIFFKSLDKCSDLSDRQKSLLMKYPEQLVDQAVKYCYHPTTQIKGGPVGRIKLLQYFLQNPDQFKEQMQHLDSPPVHQSKKDNILGRFKRGETYNGYEYLQDDIGVGFIKPGMQQPDSVNWNALNFENDLLKLLNKLEITYE